MRWLILLVVMGTTGCAGIDPVARHVPRPGCRCTVGTFGEGAWAQVTLDEAGRQVEGSWHWRAAGRAAALGQRA